VREVLLWNTRERCCLHMINANREARTPAMSQDPGASARGSNEEGERERGNGREGKIEARIGRGR
jgi:hypothetical protein